MRFMSALLLMISVFVSPTFGQEDVSISLNESEWPPIARYAEFESDNADSKIEALEKQCATRQIWSSEPDTRIGCKEREKLTA